MSTWLHRFEEVAGDGPRLAVKAMIDVAGAVTSCGSPALADAAPAARDAAVVAAMRAAGARVVGVTNCDEFGLGATGRNDGTGTPLNPRWPDRVTGGSSSGSAAAVAAGEVDIALGTDGGGSCRIPAACCGIAGLKTTPGRLPSAGISVYPMNLDSAGPLAPDVAGLVSAMRLIEPSFAPAERLRWRVGRFRARLDPPVDPAVDAAVDDALARAGVEVTEIELPAWADAYASGALMIVAAANRADGHLAHAGGVSDWARDRLVIGGAVTSAQLQEGERARTRLRADLDRALGEVDVIALPTIPIRVPLASDDRFVADVRLSQLTLPLNLAGSAAVALPVPIDDGGPPASLQLVAPPFGEEVALGAALAIGG